MVARRFNDMQWTFDWVMHLRATGMHITLGQKLTYGATLCAPCVDVGLRCTCRT